MYTFNERQELEIDTGPEELLNAIKTCAINKHLAVLVLQLTIAIFRNVCHSMPRVVTAVYPHLFADLSAFLIVVNHSDYNVFIGCRSFLISKTAISSVISTQEL